MLHFHNFNTLTLPHYNTSKTSDLTSNVIYGLLASPGLHAHRLLGGEWLHLKARNVWGCLEPAQLHVNSARFRSECRLCCMDFRPAICLYWATKCPDESVSTYPLIRSTLCFKWSSFIRLRQGQVDVWHVLQWFFVPKTQKSCEM